MNCKETKKPFLEFGIAFVAIGPFLVYAAYRMLRYGGEYCPLVEIEITQKDNLKFDRLIEAI